MIRKSYLETIGNVDLHALILFTVYMAVPKTFDKETVSLISSSNAEILEF